MYYVGNPRYARIKSISCNRLLQSKVNYVSTSSGDARNEAEQAAHAIGLFKYGVLSLRKN